MILAHQKMRLGKMAKINKIKDTSLKMTKLIIKKTFDANEMLKDVDMQDSILAMVLVLIISTLGNVDMALLRRVAKRGFGVSWSDTGAVKEVIKKTENLMSNEFTIKLRVWEGSY